MTTPSYDRILGSLSGLLMVGYLPYVSSMVMERGTPTMKNIPWEESLATQGSNFLRIDVGAADSARPSAHVNGDFGGVNTSRTAQLEFLYKPDVLDSDAQDWRAINTGARITAADMDNVANGQETTDDLAVRAINQAVDSLNYGPSFMVHSDKTGSLGAVDAKKAAALSWTNAGVYSTATTATLKIGTEHSIGAFKRDMIIDTYTGATMSADSLRIIRVDPVNDALVVEITSDSTVTDLDAITAADIIYRSGSKGIGFACAFNEIVKEDYSGDSSSAWLRKDRTLSANYIYVPEHIARMGETAKQAEISDLTVLGNSMEPFVDAEGMQKAYHAYMGPRMLQTLRDNADDSQIRVVDGETDGGVRKVGSQKIVFTHPTLGDIELEGDPSAREDRMLLNPDGCFKFWAAGSKEMRTFTGQNGVWDRVEGNNANGGGTKEWKFEADKVMTLICTDFSKVAASLNLTA